MRQSHVVEIDGVFVGAAVRESNGYRFVAVDLRLFPLNGCTWPTLADLRRLVRNALISTARAPEMEAACPA